MTGYTLYENIKAGISAILAGLVIIVCTLGFGELIAAWRTRDKYNRLGFDHPLYIVEIVAIIVVYFIRWYFTYHYIF